MFSWWFHLSIYRISRKIGSKFLRKNHFDTVFNQIFDYVHGTHCLNFQSLTGQNRKVRDRTAIWPFLNCLPKIKWFGHLRLYIKLLYLVALGVVSLFPTRNEVYMTTIDYLVPSCERGNKFGLFLFFAISEENSKF